MLSRRFEKKLQNCTEITFKTKNCLRETFFKCFKLRAICFVIKEKYKTIPIGVVFGKSKFASK